MTKKAPKSPPKRASGTSTTTRRAPAPRADSAAPGGNGAAPAVRPEAVAVRAYHLYLARGGGHGQDVQDWLDAERELGSG